MLTFYWFAAALGRNMNGHRGKSKNARKYWRTIVFSKILFYINCEGKVLRLAYTSIQRN